MSSRSFFENALQQQLIMQETRDRPVDETLHVLLVCTRIPHALLRGNHKRRNQKISIEAEKQRQLETHINKSLELQTICHLVVDLVHRNRIVRNILQVRIPEGQNNIVHQCGDAPGYQMFLSGFPTTSPGVACDALGIHQCYGKCLR